MASDSLIKLGGNLENPRDCKPSDFPAVGPTGPVGEASGSGKLVSQTVNQEGARHTVDSGPGSPALVGEYVSKIGENFKVSVNAGEGGSKSTPVSIKGSVDLSTGQMSPVARDQKY